MEQSLDRQLDALKLDGAEEIIQEKITGMKADRPELNRLLNILSDGKLIVRSGKRGKFLGYDNFPNCKFTKNIVL